MCNSIILKLEDISSIKRYFEFILSQTEKGEKFPIKLDDVFALVYSRKDKAVRALIDSDQFMQDIDYKVFPLNGENSNGGRPSMVYMLSVSCLEYFIARKVRSVFEVYRSVFHGCVYNEKRKLIPDFSNPAEAARAWADQYEAAQRAIAEKSQAEAEKQQALKTIEEHKPDVEFAESFRKVDHNNMWLIRDIAKKLEQNGVIIAEKNLRSFLEEAKFMFRNGLGKWELYSNVVAKGYGVYRSYFIDKYSGDRINQQTIYMTGSGYVAVPANSTVSTVGADTCCPVTGVNVVNPINVAVTGAAMVNGTERLLYFNKVRGVLRLMDCCVPTTTAQASEVKAGK